jgi:hypothetical protein
MVIKRVTIAVFVVAAVAAGIAAFAVISASQSEDAASVGSIKDSYAFDVKDKKQLMAYGEEVFVGEVLEAVRTDEAKSSTLWRVRVIRSVKGDRRGDALVWQLGYVDGDGRAHVAEEQPLLQPGHRVLLVTTREGEENTLVAGPAARVPVDSRADEERVVGEYRAAQR